MNKLDNICESVKQEILKDLKNINVIVNHAKEEDKKENREFEVIYIHINYPENKDELTTARATEIYRIAEKIIDADTKFAEIIEKKYIKVSVSTCYTFTKKY